MPKVITIEDRIKIIELNMIETPIWEISEVMGISTSSVNRILKLYDGTSESLVPRKSLKATQLLVSYRLVRLIKHLNPNKSIKKIYSEIRVAFPQLQMQTIQMYTKYMKGQKTGSTPFAKQKAERTAKEFRAMILLDVVRNNGARQKTSSDKDEVYLYANNLFIVISDNISKIEL